MRLSDRPSRVAVVALIALSLSPACGETKPRPDAGTPIPRSATTQAPVPREVDASAETRALLEAGRHPWLTWPDFPYLRPALQTIYGGEADGLFWFEGGRPVASLRGVIEMLDQAATHGLNPADYDAAPLAQRFVGLDTILTRQADLAAFDIAVSITAARLLAAVHEGRIDPHLVGFKYDVSQRRLDVSAAIAQARQAGMKAAVDTAAPKFPVYQRLIRALAQYRALAAGGEPPIVPILTGVAKSIAPKATWDGIPALAARLAVLGDLPRDSVPSSGTVYGPDLVAAVKRFQDRHAMEPDGMIGGDTITALNVPLAARVRQIELALERERWLPDTRTKPHIFVNVPLFRLWAYDPARPDEPLRMNVVVGKSMGHATPVFIDEMEYVVLSPYWNPPMSIVRSDIVPKARKDPGYLARQNMEIVAGGSADAPAEAATSANLDLVLRGKLFIRQKPGPANALGRAKFIFPNSDSIYMHDTPSRQLFSRARRDFSHGCIRLEHPAVLAEWVLRDQPGWTKARIDAAMAGTVPQQVNLTSTLTVMLFYDTAYVDSKGVLHFADDYYGHDAKLAKALAQGYPYPRTQ